MQKSGEDPSADASALRVSDAVQDTRREGSLRDRLHHARLWVLVDANRWTVVGVLTAAIFTVTLLFGAFGPASVRQYLLKGVVLSKGYIELQTVDVTVLTIVLAINQLVISPELGSVGDQRQRVTAALKERKQAERAADLPVSPTEPSEFLGSLARATRARAHRLEDAVAGSDDPQLQRAVGEYVEDVTRETGRVEDALADERFGKVEMVGAAMHFTTSEDIHAVRRIRESHADALSDAQKEAFEEMLDVLELFAVSREYFRSLYVQWEFINFSHAILYTGLPAVVIAHFTVGLIDSGALPGVTLGIRNLLWYEAFSFAAILVPVAVVVSYVARLSTLARASIFISPFSPPEKDFE